MPTATRLVTADELLAMGEGRRELIEGEVIEMAPAGAAHGRHANRIAYLLTRFVEDNGVEGEVYAAETGFRLSRDPDTVRAPDAAFVTSDRLPGGTPEGYLDGAPDLAAEVLSPNDTHAEIVEKVAKYLSAGTRLVWVIDSTRRNCLVFRPGEAKPTVLGETDDLDGADVLPGFRVKVAEVFR
jgi:Uma2 family endonuclease